MRETREIAIDFLSRYEGGGTANVEILLAGAGTRGENTCAGPPARLVRAARDVRDAGGQERHA